MFGTNLYLLDVLPCSCLCCMLLLTSCVHEQVKLGFLIGELSSCPEGDWGLLVEPGGKFLSLRHSNCITRGLVCGSKED